MNPVQQQVKIGVDGEDYMVQLFTPSKGLKLWTKLVRLLGVSAIKLFQSFKSTGGKSASDFLSVDLGSIDFDAVADSLQGLFAQLSDDQMVELIKEVLGETYAGLRPVTEDFDQRFMGRYKHVFKLVGKTIAVQYGDFISGLAKRPSVVSPVSSVGSAK